MMRTRSRSLVLASLATTTFLTVLAPHARSTPQNPATGAPLGDAGEPISSEPPLLLLGPVAGFTTDWHALPEELTVPTGTLLRFKVQVQAGVEVEEVKWLGADMDVLSDLQASCLIEEAAASSVQVKVRTERGLWSRETRITGAPLQVEDVRLQSVRASVSPVEIDPRRDVNEQTMAYYFRHESIAALHELGPDHYLTSVRRPVHMETEVAPAALAPLMEWRVDGRAVGLGTRRAHEFGLEDVGSHVVQVGPPSAPSTALIDTYRVHVPLPDTGYPVPEGELVTFNAATNPPGYEDYVTWISSTKYGSGAPILGAGPTFSVVFNDVWGAEPRDFIQWLGVRADHIVFNQDQKSEVVTCKDRVNFTLRIKDVMVVNDQDPALFRGAGDMYYASWVRCLGTPAKQAETHTSNMERTIDDGQTVGVNDIILDRKKCCRTPDCPLKPVEVVIYFWDDDNQTAQKIGAILDALALITAGTHPAVSGALVGLSAINEAFNQSGAPERDELGTFRAFDPALTPPADCIIDPAVTTQHDINLLGGAGADNGDVWLTWTSVRVGKCAMIEDSQGLARLGPGVDDLAMVVAAQDSGSELVLEAFTADEGILDVLPSGDTRTFQFGLNTDMNFLTGAPGGALVGSDWRVDVLQTSDGIGNSFSSAIFVWSGGAWSPTGLAVHDLQVEDETVFVAVNHVDVGAPVQFATRARLLRNGAVVDTAPDIPAVHEVTWIADDVPPRVRAYNHLPEEIAGPVDAITVDFTEQVLFAPGLLSLVPAQPYTAFMQGNRLDILPNSPLPPGDYTLTVSGSLTDVLGNALDGDGDGVGGGDPFQFSFHVHDMRVQTTDGGGAAKARFSPGESVFAVGTNLAASASFDAYLIIKDTEQEGQPLVDQSVSGATAGSTQPDGSFGPLDLSAAVAQGEYTVVLDFNSDGVYQAATDHLWQVQGIAVVVE